MKIYAPMDPPASTPEERLAALENAKGLMSSSGNGGGIMAAIAGSTKAAPGTTPEVITGMVRLADYITTGHTYEDNHPKVSEKAALTGPGVLVMPHMVFAEGADVEETVRNIMSNVIIHDKNVTVDDKAEDGADNDG